MATTAAELTKLVETVLAAAKKAEGGDAAEQVRMLLARRLYSALRSGLTRPVLVLAGAACGLRRRTRQLLCQVRHRLN